MEGRSILSRSCSKRDARRHGPGKMKGYRWQYRNLGRWDRALLSACVADLDIGTLTAVGRLYGPLDREWQSGAVCDREISYATLLTGLLLLP